jgi:hypothetical protein
MVQIEQARLVFSWNSLADNALQLLAHLYATEIRGFLCRRSSNTGDAVTATITAKKIHIRRMFVKEGDNINNQQKKRNDDDKECWEKMFKGMTGAALCQLGWKRATTAKLN